MAKRPLGMLARFINGAAFKPSDWGTEGYPIIRIQNLTGSSKTINFTTKRIKQELIVKNGDVLVSWSATLGVYKWQGPEAVLNQHIFKVVPAPGMLPDYLFYAIRGVIDDISSKTHGSTMKHVVRGDFENTLVYAPPLAEQQRIVDILDRAAAIQRLRRAAEEKAREIIPALFVDMFGDPATNPKGWEKSPMASLVKIRSSVVVPDLNVDGDLFCIGPDAISKDHGEIIATTKVKDVNPKSGKYKFFPGDVLYSKIRPSLRKATVVDELGYCSADMYAMIPSDRLTKEFLLYALLSDDFSQYVIGKSARAQMPKVNRGDIDQYRLIVPKLDLQLCFAERVRNIRDQYGLQNSSKSLMNDALLSLSERFFGQT